MNAKPASSRASRFAADSIPASATTTTSATWCRSAKPVRTGIRVLVSALLPSNRCTSRGNPDPVVSRPTVTWGSTRCSLLIPTLRSLSSTSLSVEGGEVILHQGQPALPGRMRVARLGDHGAVVPLDHPFEAPHECDPGWARHAELGQHPDSVGLTGRLDDPGEHERLEGLIGELVEAGSEEVSDVLCKQWGT